MTKANYEKVRAIMAKKKGNGPAPNPMSDPANDGPISPADQMVQDKPSPGLLG